MVRIVETDVLVIGAGGAGMRAAVEAYRAGAQVCIVLKGTIGRSGTTTFPVAEMAAFNAPDGVLDPGDSVEEYFTDIIRAGRGMADPRLARYLAENATAALHDLESFGVHFEHEGQKYMIAKGCFSTRPRMHVIRDHGIPIVRALKAWIREKDITVVENTTIVQLLVRDGRCIGTVGIGGEGEAIIFAAGATVLCTGGAGQMFHPTLNPPDITGDGYALGYRAGAELVNMEFLQMGFGFLKPTCSIFNAWLWKAYPRVTNGRGEEFLRDYLPQDVTEQEIMDAKEHYPFSSFNAGKYLEISVQKELINGRGTESGGVKLDFSKFDLAKVDGEKAWLLARMFPLTRDWLRSRGVDILRDPVEVAIFGHAVNGGLRIDTSGQTTIEGLFAAGETAGGPHGADRLGGNMMVTCQVFGRLAGINAARYAKGAGTVSVGQRLAREEKAKLRDSLNTDGRVEISTLHRQLQNLMWRHILVVRSEESLADCITGIYAIRALLRQEGCIASINDYLQRLELENLLTTAEMVTTAAKMRQESRGSHFREDYPGQDRAWDASLIISRGKDGIQLIKEKLGC